MAGIKTATQALKYFAQNEKALTTAARDIVNPSTKAIVGKTFWRRGVGLTGAGQMERVIVRDGREIVSTYSRSNAELLKATQYGPNGSITNYYNSLGRSTQVRVDDLKLTASTINSHKAPCQIFYDNKLPSDLDYCGMRQLEAFKRRTGALTPYNA